MAIALISTNKNFLKLKERIHDLDPNIEVDIWPGITSGSENERLLEYTSTYINFVSKPSAYQSYGACF